MLLYHLHLFAFLLLAQGPSVPAYTTADPINPDRLGLATSDGRYQIEFVADCGTWLQPGIQVDATPGDGQLMWLAPAGQSGPVCPVQVDQKMSDVPCFTDDSGACAVAAELDE